MSSIILESNDQRGNNDGKPEIQKLEYLDNEKSFLDEIKSIFHNYLRAITCWIKEK